MELCFFSCDEIMGQKDIPKRRLQAKRKSEGAVSIM